MGMTLRKSTAANGNTPAKAPAPAGAPGPTMEFVPDVNDRANTREGEAGYTFEFVLLCMEKPRWALTAVLTVAAALAPWTGRGYWASVAAMTGTIIVSAFIGLGFGLYGASQAYGKGPTNWTDFIDDKTGVLAAYAGKKIPTNLLIHAYMEEKVDFKCSVLHLWLHRNQLLRQSFTFAQAYHFLNVLMRDAFNHGSEKDHKDVGDVYNRGNDFYRWFLGPRMVYTSGVFRSSEESLETAQDRKLDLVCQQTQMEPGGRHLDIGCGWGTLVAHAAKNYGTKSTGCTLAKEQAKWGKDQAVEWNVGDNVDFIIDDYRMIPPDRYDYITCLEMAEHVGIKNFQCFLQQIKGLLKPDGLLYFQIAGLRRSWCFHDIVWGQFMDQYVFPGADASCPLGFVVSQLERAGFEVHRVENAGVHYSLTINRWYENWVSNEKEVVATYGRWWFRCWEIFLASSVVVAGQGSSTVFMITANINHCDDAGTVSANEAAARPTLFNRIARWVNKTPIATQG